MNRFGVFFSQLEHSPLVIFWLLVVFLLVRAAKKRAENLRILGVMSRWMAFETPVNRPLKSVLFALGTALAVAAALGPQWGQKEQVVKAQGLDICFGIDLSRSMLAEDMAPSRLQLAKNQLSIFIPRMGGDRGALVAFAGSAFVAAPLTVDHAALVDFMTPLAPSFISDQATNIGAAVEACMSALGLEDITDREQIADTAAKLVVLISDGEDNADDYKGAIARAEKLGVPVYAMAVGTERGAPIPIRSASGNLEEYFKNPRTGQPALTRLTDKGLKAVAERTGGKVFYASVGIDAWKQFEDAIANYKRESRDAGTKLAREERFQWPLLPAVLLLLLDFFLLETSMDWSRLLRRRRNGEESKKAAALGLFLIVALTGGRAHAAGVPKDDPGLVWLNKQGQRNFSKGQLKKALENYSQGVERDASDIETRFNWATTRLYGSVEAPAPDAAPGAPPSINTGEVDAALREFEAMERDGRLSGPQAALFRKALYHQMAQAHEFKKDTVGALEYYYRSVDEGAPEAGAKEAAEIDRKSRVNIARLLTQAQGGGGGGGGQDQSDQQKDDGGKGEKKPQPGLKDGEDHTDKKQQAKFTGTDLNEEQARQIMESVSGEEREVQKRKAQAEAKERAGKLSKGKRPNPSGADPW